MSSILSATLFPFIAGILFAYIYIKSNNLSDCIFIHFIWNISSVTFNYIYNFPNLNNYLLFQITTLTLILIFIRIVYKKFPSPSKIT
ncbi:MAG: CPBP family glutamic-type intramembrane protease [Clostridium sp.]